MLSCLPTCEVRDLIFSQFSIDCCQKCVCFRGSAPGPAGGLTAPPNPQLPGQSWITNRSCPDRRPCFTHVNWKKNTEKVSNKCSRIIGILNTLPQRIKLMLYNSLLLPHINYCLTTWGYQCHRLQKLQKRAIPIITLSKYNDHTAPLFKKLNFLTIKDILALQELKLYYKFIHTNVPPYIQQ